MKRYQTAAREADSELTSLLGYEGRLYLPEILENHQPSSVNLQASYEEFIQYLMEASYIRPAFKLSDTVVEIPCFFVKIDGHSESLNEQMKSFKMRFPMHLIHYNGFYILERKPSAIQQNQFRDVNHKDLNALECISELEFENLKHLSSHKRTAFLNAALMACANYQRLQQMNPNNLMKLSDDEILACAVYTDSKIIDAFHHWDFQNTPPKCWLQLQQKKIPTSYAIMRLLLLQALSFDVIICSEKGYNIIESLLTEEIYCQYRVEEKKVQRISGSRVILAVGFVVIIASWLLIQFFLVG